MKKLNRMFSLLLCAVMLFTAIPFGVVTAAAEATATAETAVGDYYYNLDFDGLNTGSISGGLNKYVEADSNPYGFPTSDTGSLSGKIMDGGNGDKYYRIDHTWPASATSGSWKGLRVSLNDGTTDHLITNAVKSSFKFRWVGTGNVDASSSMIFYKLRRHNGTDPSNANTGRLEKTLLSAKVDAETGEFVLSAYTHYDGGSKYQEVYRFPKESTDFSDISLIYYDASATYSVYIDGKPVVESVYIGYANNSKSIDIRDPEYVVTTYDGALHAVDRQPASTIEKWAFEFFRISRGSIANAGYVFDIDSFVMEKVDSMSDNSYYYSNSFDTIINSDENANAHNDFDRQASTSSIRLQGTASKFNLAEETIDGVKNGYLDMGAGTRIDYLDHYQLFQDGNFTVSFKLRADDSTGDGTRLLNINPYGDTGTLGVLFIDGNGYISLASASNPITNYKVPSIASGEWLKVTISVVVTNQNTNSVSFIDGNPLNGRICYALWLNDELCGIYNANDGGPYRSKISGSTLITNKNFTKTSLTAAPTEAELEGYTLSTSESTDKFKVYRHTDGSFYQLQGTTSGGVFTFSSGVLVKVTSISARSDSLGILNKASNIHAHIDDLQYYYGIGPAIYAKSKADTTGVISSVNFASLSRTVYSSRNNSSATANVATSLGGRDGFMQADALNSNYATEKTDNDKKYITLSNLSGISPYYDLHVTNSGGKMFSAQLVLRNLVSSTDVKLMRIKRQAYTATKTTILERLFAEGGTGYLYFNDSVYGKAYLVNDKNERYSLSGSEWMKLEMIVDERSGKLLVSYLINGECAYYMTDDGLMPAKALYFGSTADTLYSLKDAIDQRISLYRIESTDANTSLDILSAKVEYTDKLPDAEAIVAGLLDMSATDYSGKLYSAKITMSGFAPANDAPIIRPVRQYNETTPVYNFDTLFVEAETGNLFFEHDNGYKYYLVDSQRVRYSVAGKTGVTPEIIFNETGDKILVTFLVDGKVAYYDSKDGLVPAREIYIGGDTVHALKNASLQKIRFYHGVDASVIIDNATAALRVVESIPEAEEIKWADSAYINFADYESIEELGDQFEWTEGVTIENGVLKIPEGGSFTWIDYNAVLIDYIQNHLSAVNGQYLNGFTIEMKAKANVTSNALVELSRGTVKNDRLVYLSNGYVHMSGGVNSGYRMNLVGSDKYTDISATFTNFKNEANVFADGYLLGISRYTSFGSSNDRLAKISIVGESEIAELRIHRDLEREFAKESGELFKLDADILNPANKSGEYRINSEGVMTPGVLKNPAITKRMTYTDETSGESFAYFRIAPNGAIESHTHTDIFLNGYLEDKVTVFEYDFRYTPGTITNNVELCYIRRTEDNNTTPLWDWLLSISSKGYYSLVNNLKICDEQGNLLVASAEDWNKIAIIYDADAGLVSYRLNGKIPYCTDGNNVVLAENIQLPNYRYYRMDSAETQIRTLGMYTDSDQILDIASINIYTVGDSANAEYVGVQTATEENSIRVVAGLDMLYYGAAGFEVEAFDADGNSIAGSAKSYYTKEVYSSIVETTAEGEKNIYPQDYGYRYFLTANIEGIPTDEAVKLNVTPFTYTNGVKYSSATVTLDVDFNKSDRNEITATESIEAKPQGNNTSGNFSTTEIVSYTNDGALELNGLDAAFAFSANLKGGVVSVNLTNAKGEVAEATVLDLYVDGKLTEEGITLDFGRHTLVLAENLTGEHTFKIVKRSGGDFVCVNSMSFCGQFTENPPALATVGAVSIEVSAPKSGAEYGDVSVYVQTSDESGDYYIQYNFAYLNYAIDSKMIDADNSVNPGYSTGGGNTEWNCHMYRVKTANLYKKNENGTYTKQFSVLHQGEISVAVKEFLNGVYATDFVGGYHGDENAYAITFLADGQVIDTSKAGKYNGVTTFEVLQETVIDRCNEPDTPLLDHKQHFLLDTNGLRIDRHIEVLAEDFAPSHSSGYTMMATVYRIGANSKADAENVEETYNVKTMNVLNANGELSDDTSVFDMTDGNYTYRSGSAKSVTCASDSNKINRYAEYTGDKGFYGKVGFVIDDASMEAKSVDIQVRLTYGDNKWYACIGSYSATTDGAKVPKGEKWNLSTYYFFDYNTANITAVN